MTASAPTTRTNVYHSFLFALIVVAMCLIKEAVPNWSMTYDLALLTFMVAFLGIPHGALDHRIGSLMFEGKTALWQVTFLSLYALTALGVMLLWSWFPGVCLLLFLLISVVHFGDSDRVSNDSRLSTVFEALIRGLLPIILPTALYPEQVHALYTLLSTQDTSAWLITIAEQLLMPTLLLCGIMIAWNLWRCLSMRTHNSITVSIELLTIVLLFVWLPPLAAFALYFGLLHSVRHLLTVARDCSLTSTRNKLTFLVANTLPITLFVLTAALLVYLLMPEGRAYDQRLIQILFIGLAALTVPHMVLVGVAKWKHTIT